jgi:hypothetical protein
MLSVGIDETATAMKAFIDRVAPAGNGAPR